MWALTGTLQSADVLRQLDAYNRVGWGVVLYPRWGLELEYLGEAWFERIRFIVEQADARDMEVWLYDEFCWPSGHAKGLVTQDRPELEAQLLLVEPDGRSRVERVPGSANLLLPAATQRFLEVTHQRYAQAVGPFLGRCVRAIFTDEPSLGLQHRRRPPAGSWQFAWSAEMEKALGGDFRQRLAAAADPAGWSGWRDYWAAYAQVFHDAWVAPIARWCQAQGIAMTGHFLGEGSFGSQVAFNGSLRRQMATFGIPGIDEIHTRPDPAKCEALTLAAIAELEGRERMVEAYALGPPNMKMETMRRMVDVCSACGVDRYVLAICPHDLSGGVFKREYLGIHSPQQPWFQDFARQYTDYLGEAAERARKAQPLGVPWPSDEEMWAAAGPDPRRSKALQAMTSKFVAAAREAIRARLPQAPAVPSANRPGKSREDTVWAFQPVGLNSLRVDRPTLNVLAVPSLAELSVQCQLVRSLTLNGTELDWEAAPPDEAFDLSYRRLSVAHLLRKGENHFVVDTADEKPLRFLPAVILWGDFGVDAEGRLVAQPKTVPLGDWRQHGYPALCGTGRYRAVVDFDTPPAQLTVDTGDYPVRVTLNGKQVGRRAWPPFDFDLRQAARSGRNEIVVEVTSTLGHLFVPSASPPVGLLAAEFA